MSDLLTRQRCSGETQSVNEAPFTAAMHRGAEAPLRRTMNGKTVYLIPAKSVLNLKSGFVHKKLCDGPSFSTGSACAYNCAYCFTKAIMRRHKHYLASHGITAPHETIVIRREGAIERLQRQLTDRSGRPKFKRAGEHGRVVYASPLVDVAANAELCQETIEACQLILNLTSWDIRLLSKSNLLPRIAAALGAEGKKRVIYGVSTGTLDDKLGRVIEDGTPLVSKRLQSLHALQDEGCRTFGMICPSLPQEDYDQFAAEMAAAIRAERCEHVWAEVINVRGESMTRTVTALEEGGFGTEARRLQEVSTDQKLWEQYARATFLAHRPHYKPGQLRFLQYVRASTKGWWSQYQADGAVLL